MGFGKEWNWGADKETSLKILDTFANNGGNFIDTANRYTEGTSEKIIGEFIHSNRDNFIVATKYSLHDNLTNVNASGNNRKNMMRSVEESLKRLNTDFIDLFYLHIWDNLTPMDEVLRGLDDLVTQGKVNYIGISDTPAWLVSQAQTMAELMGWSRFVALQVEYSLLQRTPERELIPMAKHYNLTVTPWAPLAGGALTGKYTKGDKGRLPPESKRLNERAIKITEEVIALANELNVQPSSVALKWTMQQGFSCIPIIGATKPEQFIENLKCLDVTLSNEHINRLNQVSKIELGFPGDFFLEDGVKNVLYGGFFDRIEKR
jgi:aryl-alcohol dehydrogenase-like predicted oxidoreductase